MKQYGFKNRDGYYAHQQLLGLIWAYGEGDKEWFIEVQKSSKRF